MYPTRCQRITRFCRNFTRWFLLVLSILLFIFALFSGADGFGGGIAGVVQNAPNALPWLLLLIINWVVWKSEVMGSILLIAFAVAAGYFFGGFVDNRFVLYVITFPLIILSLLLLMYHYCQLKHGRLSERN